MGEIWYVFFVIIDTNYWIIKLVISNKTKNKFKTCLKSKRIFKDVENPMAHNNEISVLAKKEFIDPIIRIMLGSKCKTKIIYLFNDKTYLFMYDMREIIPGQFSNLGNFSIKNFQVRTSIAVEVEINFQNFK